MESLWQDLRFGLRTLQRDPGFATVAVLILALGIGVTLAIGSIAQVAVFRSLPYDAPERLVLLRHLDRAGNPDSLSIPEFLDLDERHRVFDAVAMGRSVGLNLGATDGEPERLAGLMVSAGLGPVLGIELALGRWFLPEDDLPGAPQTVIVSYELWQRGFAGDPEILGRVIRLDDLSYVVVGVLPEGLSRERLGPGGQVGDLLVPIGAFRELMPFDDRSARPQLWGLARLSATSTLESTQSDLARISAELAREFPDSDTGRLEAIRLGEYLFAGHRPTYRLLLAVAGLVLLIGCGNLVNLLLGRFSARRTELSTRRALGAGRGRLWRQLLGEAVLLGLCGGVVGIGLAWLTLRLLPRLLGSADDLVRAEVDTTWMVATLIFSVLISVLVFLLPGYRVLQRVANRSSESLKTRGFSRSHRLRWGLVVVEIALAFVTLVGALLMLGSMERLRSLDSGFRQDAILSFKVLLAQDEFDQEIPWVGFFDEALERLRGLPGLEQVAVTSLRPPDEGLSFSRVAAGDRTLPANHEYEGAAYQMVSPGFFETLGIPLLQGRDFGTSDDDRLGAERVVVVSESLARRFWPGSSAIDKTVAFEFLGTPKDPEPQWRRIVGVVADIHQEGPRNPPQMAAYVPYTQVPLWTRDGSSPVMAFVLETSGGVYAPMPGIRQVLREIDPDQPLYEVISLDDAIELRFAEPHKVTVLLTTFALLALLLVLVGVFGVVNYIVTATTHEIGIRMALGASRGKVLADLLRRSAFALLVGCVVGGVLVRFALEPLIQSQLYGIEGATLGSLLVTSFALGAIAILGTLVPAWKATRVTPAQALHYE